MAAVADLIQYVAPYVAGCPDPVITRALNTALDRFCKESWYYRKRVDAQRILPTDTVVGDFSADYPDSITINGATRFPVAKTKNDNYVVDAPSGMRPYVIVEAVADGVALLPVNSFAVSYYAGWQDKEGPAQYFTQIPAAVTEIFPTPDTPPELTFVVAYTVEQDATTIPNVLAMDFRQTIVDGALASLLAQPDQGYSDPNSAVYFERKFKSGIAAASVIANRGGTRAPVRARLREWV